MGTGQTAWVLCSFMASPGLLLLSAPPTPTPPACWLAGLLHVWYEDALSCPWRKKLDWTGRRSRWSGGSWSFQVERDWKMLLNEDASSNESLGKERTRSVGWVIANPNSPVEIFAPRPSSLRAWQYLELIPFKEGNALIQSDMYVFLSPKEGASETSVPRRAATCTSQGDRPEGKPGV